MNELALFAGAGGGILGGRLIGWRTVCAVEIDPYARRVLLARQDDGCLEPFPIWDDVCTFDGRPWAGLVDVVSGGFPCQDISCAGKGGGIAGSRSGLWREMARIIGEVRPRFAFVENSPVLTSRGLGTVLGDLAALGYDATWGVLGACDAGAPHRRERIWITAESDCHGRQAGQAESQRGATLQPHTEAGCEDVADAYIEHEQGLVTSDTNSEDRSQQGKRPAGPRRNGVGWWATEPDMGRVAHGVAYRVDRLRCLGNGQVPAVARLSWETLK